LTRYIVKMPSLPQPLPFSVRTHRKFRKTGGTVNAACLVCGRFGIQIPDRPNLIQRCKRFATASTST